MRKLFSALAASVAVAALAVTPAAAQSGPPAVAGFYAMPSPTITVGTGSHAAGQCEGGLIVLSGATRWPGAGGTLVSLGLQSKGGQTATFSAYVFTRQPVTTCADGAAFSLNAADRPYLVGGQPIPLALATVNSGTGDTATYASLTTGALPFVNQDTTPGTSLYVYLVPSTSTTPASSSDLILTAGAVQ
jgi:hypothetical protein